VLLNYPRSTGVIKDAEEFVDGVTFRDAETARNSWRKRKWSSTPRASPTRCAAWRCHRAADDRSHQGIHLVFDGTFFPATPIMVPHTSDGAVGCLAIPGRPPGVGNTDTPVAEPRWSPVRHGNRRLSLFSRPRRLYLPGSPARPIATTSSLRPRSRACSATGGRSSAWTTPSASKTPAC